MKKILIVDDDSDFVNLIAAALKSAPYEVTAAGDPIKGLQAARAQHPDLILLDYHLPGTNGAHLFETFRRNQATADTPILFMSGKATPKDIVGETAECGRSRFLPKPIHIAELLKVVHEMLQG